MGFFSWKTNDTKRSIPSTYSAKKTFPVHLWVPGNKLATEEGYDGYGEFEGLDYFEVFAELNKDHPLFRGKEYDEEPDPELGNYFVNDRRGAGIEVLSQAERCEEGIEGLLFPQLMEGSQEPADFSRPPELLIRRSGDL